jgi:hypothetical protein
MEAVLFLVGVAVIAILGVGIGMLVAPRIQRVMDPPDEDDVDRTP